MAMAGLGSFVLLAAFVAASYAIAASVAGARRRSTRLVESGVGAFYRTLYPATYARRPSGVIATPVGVTPPRPTGTKTWLAVSTTRTAPNPVAAMMAPYENEIAAYRIEEMVPLGRLTLRPRAVNWKTIADNYSDSLHINVAHPGLTRLFGRGYGIEAHEWVHKMWGRLREEPSGNRSERMYQRYLPPVAHLPDDRQRLWVYFKLWPNLAFDIYPDQIDFMQFVPVSATSTLIREIAYVHPDTRRAMRAARYLNWRINRQVNKEDTDLINRVQAGMASSSYEAGPLVTNEVCLRQFARKLRALAPVAREQRAPPPGWSRSA